VKNRPRLYLVGRNPTDLFDDIDQLRAKLQAPTPRRRSGATFARIPHDQGLALCRVGIGWAAWAVLIELDRLVLKGGGRNPARLWSSRLRGIGVSHAGRARALRQLEAAGVIEVERRGSGLSPWVRHLWYPRQD
jgi:hypothetical protein